MKIYAISDNHGKLHFDVPPCDLLLVGGDVCPDFAPGSTFGSAKQEEWFKHKWKQWELEQPAKKIYGTLGNHDFLWRRQLPENFVIDSLVEVDGIKIWFSPWSKTFGGWAWMNDEDTLKEGPWALIPEEIDILVTHQPPYGYGDPINPRFMLEGDDPHVGSKALLEIIDRVKPKVVICGHIHSGHGKYTYKDTTIYNVSLVNESYQLTHKPTEIFLS